MKSRITILNELQSISPLVASISAANPYPVPNGYFDGLADQIMQRIEAEGRLPSGFLGELDKITPFDVPEGYFDGLADNVLKRIKAEMASSPKDELEILSPLLGQLDKRVPFSTPPGYFEELTEGVVAGTKAIEFVNEELENLSPVMSSLQSIQVYEVPADYFQFLPNRILSRARSQQPAKVISLTFVKKAARYAVAALVAGILVTGGVLFLNKPASVVSDPGAEVAKTIETATDNEIENFLENLNLSNTDENISTASSDIDADDVKELFADVSEEELSEYINEYGNIQNAVTN